MENLILNKEKLVKLINSSDEQTIINLEIEFEDTANAKSKKD